MGFNSGFKGLILWDHRLFCGPSLNETSLRGPYLYNARLGISALFIHPN